MSSIICYIIYVYWYLDGVCSIFVFPSAAGVHQGKIWDEIQRFEQIATGKNLNWERTKHFIKLLYQNLAETLVNIKTELM